jgi:hypothetical protein
MLDTEYYNRIHKFINQAEDKVYEIAPLTNDYEKFIYHIRHYIDHCNDDDFVVTLMGIGPRFTHIRVLEFFDGKIYSQKTINNILANAQKAVDDRWNKIKHLPEKEILKLSGVFEQPVSATPKKAYDPFATPETPKPNPTTQQKSLFE